MEKIQSLLLELDKLKSIYRKSYITGEVRYENSAEHSWHLATAILAFADYFPRDFDITEALKIALYHDICEIGADDVCTYFVTQARASEEKAYLSSLSAQHPKFGKEAMQHWQEYEDQNSLESKWVKAIDKLLPFMLNIASKGKTWQEQGITKEMVVKHHAFIEKLAPDIYAWMLLELDIAEQNGWFHA